MKNAILLLLLSFLVVQLTPTLLSAQYKKKSNESITDKLWYGGGFNLGIGGSTFNLGVSPMVGYKISDRLSVGPRIPLDYSYVRLTATDGSNLNYNNLDWGLGAFSRFKLLRSIFTHVEYNYRWVNDPVTSNGFYQLDPEDPSKILTQANNRDEFNIGLGYTGGGRFGTEISLLYNVLNEENSTSIPWSIRVGFNYNF